MPSEQHTETGTIPTAGLPEDLWVVIPAYNERGRIGAVLDELLQYVNNIVVVDDGSTDDTSADILSRPVWLLQHKHNLGQGAALQTGIDFALARGCSHIITFDSDGQHCPEDIGTLYDAIETHHSDFALGSRFLGKAEGIPLARRLMLKAAVVFTRILSGMALSDTHNGIRAMTRRGARSIHITANRMDHASELIDQIGKSRLKYVEVPVTIRYSTASLEKGQKTSAAIRLGLKLLLDKVTK